MKLGHQWEDNNNDIKDKDNTTDTTIPKTLTAHTKTHNSRGWVDFSQISFVCLIKWFSWAGLIGLEGLPVLPEHDWSGWNGLPEQDWVFPSKKRKLDGVFQGLAVLLRGKSQGPALPAWGKPCPSRLFYFGDFSEFFKYWCLKKHICCLVTEICLLYHKSIKSVALSLICT